MKPRTVIVTLEVETDAPLKWLRSLELWQGELAGSSFQGVRQVSAQVAQAPKKGKK